MTDKSNKLSKNPITEFSSLFVSNPNVVKDPGDYGDYDKYHLAPLSDLLKDNDETKFEK